MSLRKYLLENAFTKDGSKLDGNFFSRFEENHLKELHELTSFFPENIKIADRIYAFLNGQTKLNKCISCDKELLPKTLNPQVYCDIKCASKSPLVLAKSKRDKYISEGLSLREYLFKYAFSEDGNRINGNLNLKIEEDKLQELISCTSFFLEEVTLSDRIYAYLNGQTKLNRCIVCTKEIHPKINNPQLHCESLVCQQKSEITIRRTLETNLEKYGAINSSLIETIKAKTRATNLEKYGVNYFTQTQEFLDKRVKSYNNKYGVNHPLQAEEMMERIKNTVINRYGVDNVSQLLSSKDKIIATNRIRYGCDHTLQSIIVREKGKKTVQERYGVDNVGSLMKADQRLEDFNWLKENYRKMGSTGIAKELGVCSVTVCKYLKKHNIELNFSGSSSERALVDDIRSFYPGEIIVSSRRIISPFEIDIFIPEHKLAIEYNGVYWHSELNGKDKNYHLNKTIACEQKGIQLLHIFDNESLELWLSVIRSKLGINEHKIGARQTIIKDVSDSESRIFLEQNHLQGYVSASHRLGLYYEKELVALMTFNKPRFSGGYKWELIRFCNKCGWQVMGAASKLLKAFNQTSIISYANRRWSNGKLYETLGFQKLPSSPPNYFYTSDYITLESRNKYQKHKLQEKLANFNLELSETENMFNHGYDRIWDCGNLVYSI